MTKRFLLIVVLLCMALPARAANVAADLSSHRIDVSVGFSGTKLLVFGALRTPADVAVVIKGPLVRAKLWTKKRELGIWINGHPVAFRAVPGFYAIASTQPLDGVASPETLERYGLSLDALAQTEARHDSEIVLSDYLDLITAQKHRGLFQDKPDAVRVMEDGLFRVDFDLPDLVPIGAYKAYIYLLQEGKVAGTKSVPFTVEQIGMEASIYNLAHERPFLYAFLALVSSLGLGGAAAYLFRKVV